MEQNNFKNIKLIVSDMDGTLLYSDHTLDPRFFDIYQALKKNGVQFAAASGRQYHSLKAVLAPIAEEIYFVAENGSYVVHQGQDLHVEALSIDSVRQLLAIGRNISTANLVLCGKNYAYIENPQPEFVSQLSIYFNQYKIVDNLDTVLEQDDILKFTLCDLTGSEKNCYPHFQHLHDKYQVKVSANIWLDISDKKVHKGNALAFLQKQLGITPNETMAFGDYLNDLEMMSQAYFSYAMENAHIDVKKAARFEARTNDEAGVLQVLDEVLTQF